MSQIDIEIECVNNKNGWTSIYLNGEKIKSIRQTYEDFHYNSIKLIKKEQHWENNEIVEDRKTDTLFGGHMRPPKIRFKPFFDLNNNQYGVEHTPTWSCYYVGSQNRAHKLCDKFNDMKEETVLKEYFTMNKKLEDYIKFYCK